MEQFSYENLPEEMKQATVRHRKAIERCWRAEKQAELWRREAQVAERERVAIELSYGEVSMRWDPEKNVMTAKLEEAPPA